MAITERLHTLLQVAFKHFNKTLFDSCLPSMLFSEHKEKGMMAYFSPDRWTSGRGKNHHEIAINLEYICHSTLLDLMQLLVHEMVHCWQYECGEPSKKHHVYHDKEWSDKMLSIGLIPTATGKPKGKKTGQHMSDYPEAGGLFIETCVVLLDDKTFTQPWRNRMADLQQAKKLEPHICKALKTLDMLYAKQLTSTMNSLLEGRLVSLRQPRARKVKYTCPNCNVHVWGEPRLSLRCNDCDEMMFVE